MRQYRLFFFSLVLSLTTTSVAADVVFKVEGIENQKAVDNLTVFLKGLTVPKNADNDTFLSQVEETSKNSLIALGYYHAEITAVVSNKESENKILIRIGIIHPEKTDSIIVHEDDQIVIINVKLGIRTSIVELDIRLTGEALQDSTFQKYLKNFPIKEGDFLDHGIYDSAKSRFRILAQRYGYFDAEFKKSIVEVTQKQNKAVVHIWFDSGIRYQFGELLFGKNLPAERFVRSLVNFKTGDPFDTNIIHDFNQDLNETGYFRSITILPGLDKKEGRLIPMNVVASMRPTDSFNAGFGFSTDEGFRGKFRWFRPWINQYGHSVEANITASLPKQEASIVYKLPIDDPLYNYFSIQSGFKVLDQNDTDTTQYVTSFNRHWRLDNDWLRTIYIRYDNESGRQGQQDFATELILPGISFSRTRRKGGINMNWGDKLLVFFELASEHVLSSDDVVKTYGQAKLLRTYSDHQFLLSGELGAISADSIYNVPSSMRFFTGGDQSIRGYGYEEIAPRDSQDYLVGGLYLAVASLEYRFPVAQQWKIALFSDGGTATDDFSEPISFSAGTGVVWASPVGPIRLYVAFPFTETDDNYRIHLMIGPEL